MRALCVELIGRKNNGCMIKIILFPILPKIHISKCCSGIPMHLIGASSHQRNGKDFIAKRLKDSKDLTV